MPWYEWSSHRNGWRVRVERNGKKRDIHFTQDLDEARAVASGQAPVPSVRERKYSVTYNDITVVDGVASVRIPKTSTTMLLDSSDIHLVLGMRITTSNGYALINSRPLHRIVLGMGRGGLQVDHINGNRMDNRRCNLRKATAAQNGWNRTAQKNSSTGLKGISPYKGRWRAEIVANGVRKVIGSFPTPQEAKDAYDAEAARLHGEFARP